MSLFHLVIAVIRPRLFGGRCVSVKFYSHSAAVMPPPKMARFGNTFELRRYFTSRSKAKKWARYLIATHRIKPAPSGQLLLF